MQTVDGDRKLNKARIRELLEEKKVMNFVPLN